MFATLETFSRGIARGKVESFVDGEPAVSFGVVAIIPDELDESKPKPK